MVPLFRVYKNEPVTARKGKKREPAVIGQCGVAMESFTAGCVRAMAVDLLHDAQFPLVFLAPTYQAWKEIPSVVFGDLFCSLGPVDHRVSCTVHRWCSGLRTPWALLRDGSPVILVPGGSGTIECRLSPGYPAHPCEQSGAHLHHPDSSTFAETTTPVPHLYPGTVDSPFHLKVPISPPLPL